MVYYNMKTLDLQKYKQIKKKMQAQGFDDDQIDSAIERKGYALPEKSSFAKNVVGGALESAKWVPKLLATVAQKPITSAVSKATWIPKERVQSSFKKEVLWESFGDKSSRAFKATKFLWDAGQLWAGTAVAGKALAGTKLAKGVDAVSKAWLLGRAAVGGVGAAAEQTAYTALAEQRAPTKQELAIAWSVGTALPILWAGFSGIKGMLKGAPQTVDDVVGRISQAKDPKEIKRITKALTEFDFSKAKSVSYDDILKATQDKIQVLSSSFDNFADDAARSVDDLNIITKLNKRTLANAWQEAGEGAIKRNFVKESLDLLEDHYAERGADNMVLKLQEIRKNPNMTTKQVNEIAKMIPSDKALNPFTAGNSPKTSKLAQNVENLRKGLKETTRQMAWGTKGAILKDIDGRLSDLITLRSQLEKNIKAAQGTKNKVVQRSVGENAGRFLGKMIDNITFGWRKGFVTWSVKGNVGNKTLNRIDIERNLAKQLKLLNALDDFGKFWATEGVEDIAKKLAKGSGIPVKNILELWGASIGINKILPASK